MCTLHCTLSHATDNPRLMTYPPQKIMGFMGLDTKSKAPNLQDGRATDLLNVQLTSSLDLRKRYGKDTVNITLDDYDISSPAVTGIFDPIFSDDTSETFVFVGKKIKYDNSGFWTEVGNWYSSPTVTTGKNYQWQCVMALDEAVCTNDTDVPLKIDSTPTKTVLDTSDLTDTLTKAKALIWYRNYLILGNTVENSVESPTKFRWSDVGTIETYQDDNYDDISSLSGDEIQKFVELYGELYMIMLKSIWKASLVGGDDIFVYNKMIDGIGTISKGSVQILAFPDNKLGIVFLTEDRKIYLFNGVTVLDLGHLIQPTLDNLSASRLQYSVSAFDGQNYYLSASTGSSSENDTVYVYNTEMNEWYVYDQIDANAMARVKEDTSVIKTYTGNYDAMVYWMDNPDNINDVDEATGVIDSVGTVSSSTETGAQVIIDATIPDGEYTGCIVKITSGTGAGQEGIVLTDISTSGLVTGLVLTSPFGTTPDSTSNYSIGDIDAYYETKWYDFGDAPRMKGMRGVYFWAEEASNNKVTTSYSLDYGTIAGSENKDLSPSSTSLWDSGLWDIATWGTTGDKFYTTKLKGKGRVVKIRFAQPNINKSFHLYGFHLLGERLDVE